MNYELLTGEEVRRVLDRVPAAVRKVLQSENVVLAGGVIRDTLAGLPVKDIDVFCHSMEQAERLACSVSAFVRHSTFAYTTQVDGVPVQFVYYKDFADARDLVRQFDFRACCAGISWTGFNLDAGLVDFEGIAVEGFHADCRDRVLRFMSQEKDRNKLTALRRALNFTAKGWWISDDDLSDILLHWQGVTPADVPELEYTERRGRVRIAFRPGYGGRL